MQLYSEQLLLVLRKRKGGRKHHAEWTLILIDDMTALLFRQAVPPLPGLVQPICRVVAGIFNCLPVSNYTHMKTTDNSNNKDRQPYPLVQSGMVTLVNTQWGTVYPVIVIAPLLVDKVN